MTIGGCRFATVLAAILGLWAVAAPLAAQEDPAAGPHAEQDPPELEAAIQEAEAVIITATLHEQSRFDLPWIADRVSGREMVLRRSVPDALKNSVGVHVQKTSYGQNSPYIRGLTGYHTVLLLDGIRLNNSTWRSGPNEYFGLVDPYAVERMELVLGPGSVLYGSDAVGGALNVFPLRPDAWGPSGWERRLLLRYSSAENSITARAQVSGRVEGVIGFLLGGSVASYDDLKAGGDVDRQAHTGYRSNFQDAAFEIPLDERWSLGLLYQRARLDDVPRTHRTIHGISYHGTTIGSDRRRRLDFDRDLAAITLQGLDLDGFIDRVDLRLSYQWWEEQQDRIRGSGTRDLAGFDVETFGVQLGLSSDTPVGRLSYGIDYYRDRVNSWSKRYDGMGNLTQVGIQGQVGDDSRYDLLGIYLQDEVEILDSLNLIVGGRFTYADADADKVEDPDTGGEISLGDSWTNLVGSARLLWRTTDALHLYASASRAFRAPNLSDLTRLDSARTNEIEVPTEGLDPENFFTLEVGGKVRWEGLSFEAAYFHTWIDDLVIRQPTNVMVGGDVVVAKRNAGDGHLQGVNLGLDWQIDANWSVFGSFSWVDGQVDTYPTSAPTRQTEVLDRLAPIQGRIGVGWQTTGGDFQVKVSALIVDAQDRLSTRDRADTSRIPPGGTPGYTLYDLDAAYRIDDRSEIFLSVQNIGDKNYRTHGSGVQGPGLNIIIGADITF